MIQSKNAKKTKMKPAHSLRLSLQIYFHRLISSHDRLAFLLFSIIWVALLYGPCVSGPFVYDDIGQIKQNAALGTLTGIHHFLTSTVPFTSHIRSFSGSYYRPLFWLSLAIGRQLWGLDPTGFHLTNLLLHIANGFLLYLLLCRMRLPKLFAALSCFVWLTLPTSCEAVAWISGRTYPLSFFFILLALHGVLSYLQKPRHISLFLYVCFFLLACLSNDAGILEHFHI